MKKPKLSNSVIDYDAHIIRLCDKFEKNTIDDVSFEFMKGIKMMIVENKKSLNEDILIIDQNRCVCVIDRYFFIDFDEIFYLNNMI